MDRGLSLCLCVLMAVLATRAWTQPLSPAGPPGPGTPGPEDAPRRQLRAAPRTGAEPRARLGALLARYLQQARKEPRRPLQARCVHVEAMAPRAPSGRMTVVKSLQGLDPNHRISDRDYVGWMDFGRRSAEESEYPAYPA